MSELLRGAYDACLFLLGSCIGGCGSSTALPPPPAAPPPTAPLAAAASTSEERPPEPHDWEGPIEAEPADPAVPPSSADPAQPTQTDAAGELSTFIAVHCPPGDPPAALSAGARAAWRKPPRTLSALVTEIYQTEAVFKDTSKSSTRHELLERRLAAQYFELEARAYRECTASAPPSGASPGTVRQLALTAKQRVQTAAAARAAAERHCAALVGTQSACPY